MAKPLKRHKALVQYSKEHHFGLLLGWKIRQGIRKGVEPPRIANYILEAFKSELLPHFNSEEADIFILMDADDPQRIKAEKDHIAIKKQIEHIGTDQSVLQMEALADMLDEHIRFEERQLFPHIEQQKSFETFANAMEHHEASRHEDFDAGWDDHFWSQEP